MERFTGRVGATWMTKVDRLNEIKDYLGYLNTLYTKTFEESAVTPEDVNIKIMGFSQGTATVSRWIYDQKVRFDELSSGLEDWHTTLILKKLNLSLTIKNFI